ncbi:MAG: hypothetical protein C0404_14365 [Verrucomicrobia bacterium]|nr:hypothetical protein [Verrucomicrobiota bacterium]
MAMNLRIRRAKEEDLPRLVSLWWQLQRAHYEYDLAHYKLASKGKVCARFRKHLQKMIHDKETVFLVADDNSEVLGSLLARVVDRSPIFYPRQKYAVLDRVMVDEKHRGKGIYSKLQKQLERMARDRRAVHIELYVDVANPALNVYKRSGYMPRHVTMIKKL